MQTLKKINSVLACCWAIILVQIIQEIKEPLTQQEFDLQSLLSMQKIDDRGLVAAFWVLLLNPVLSTRSEHFRKKQQIGLFWTWLIFPRGINNHLIFLSSQCKRRNEDFWILLQSKILETIGIGWGLRESPQGFNWSCSGRGCLWGPGHPKSPH